MILKNGLVLGPYWGESIQSSIGRDQLGIQATSIATYAKLLPGLTNLTQRIRYYSFYAWLVEKYATQVKNKTQLKFRQFIRRGEILFAFSSLYSDYDQHGIPGSLFVKQYIKKNGWPNSNGHLNIAEFADKGSKKTYWQHDGGAFEQYYIGPLKIIGILGETDDGTLGITDNGKLLSGSFIKSVSGKCETIFFDAIQKGKISFSSLKILSKKINCHTISSKSQEAKLLIDYLFSADGEGDYNFRYESLILFLKYINKEGSIDRPRNFPMAVYYDKTSNNKSIPFPNYPKTLKAWEFYIINEYTHFSLESIFQHLLTFLHQDGSWFSIESCTKQFIKSVLRDINKILPLIKGVKKSTQTNKIIELLSHYKNARWSQKGSPEWFSDYYTMNRVVAAPVLTILSLLSRHQKESGSLLAFSKANHIYRFGSFLDIFQNILGCMEAPFERFLEVLLCQEVIGRHLKVAYQKLNQTNKNTLKFVYEHNSLLWLNNSNPTWTNPRLGSLINFLKDLKILNEDGAITKFGEKVYASKTEN